MQRLSGVLVTGGASAVARMAAGLQLKNQLTSKDIALKSQYQQRWLAIPAESRDYVKKNVSALWQKYFLILFRGNVFFMQFFSFIYYPIFRSSELLVLKIIDLAPPRNALLM